MTQNFKTSGFIRAGFKYQDLVAIESLIDFYRDRTRFQWIEVEAGDGKYNGIEDVVACRKDGRVELTQVKFAVDPAKPKSRLDWDWLTRSKKRGTSLLQKWGPTTLAQLDGGKLAVAQLKTDRIPDADFARVLDGPKVDYARLTEDVRKCVELQLGGEDRARQFFAAFEFHHSQPHLDDLEEKLWARIASDTNRGGWALFCAQVERWATRRNSPGPDGRIRYVHLQNAFSIARPVPIPQGFRVPPSYSSPDTAFDTAFVRHVSDIDGVTVLWGPPGRGKSTYLSHCIARFDRRKTICVRHHFFLSLDDRSEGRFSVHAIARSIEDQLGDLLPNRHSANPSIRHLVEEAAQVLRKQGRRLIIVIDGLDHVWREKRDHEQLEELFDGLLPLVEDVHLVVGTQKISLEHLPSRLIAAKPPESWTELPLMSPVAVRKWIALQDQAGRLDLSVQADQRAREREAVADVFHAISAGLPLHLIYSFEMIARSGEPISAARVAMLPPCPTGDIRDYYRTFLDRASPRARQILHLLAGLRFGPPPFALAECLGGSEPNAIAEIGHLLEFRETDVIPFHGSIFAYVADLDGHDAEFRALAKPVVEWLESKAPAYWRDAWLWVTKAQLGDDSALIAGPDWYWAVDFLAKGYPIEQLTAILGHAEQSAFERLDLARLLALRSVKIRTLNGPEFQTNEWYLFRQVAAMITSDPVLLSLLRTSMVQAPPKLLPFIVAASDATIRDRVAQQAIDEINERIARSMLSEDRDRDHFRELARSAAGVVAALGPSSADRLVAFAKRNDGTDATIAAYARASVRLGHFDNVFAAATRWQGREFDRELFAGLALDGLDPAFRPTARGMAHPATRVLALLKGGTPKPARRPRDLASRLDKGPDPGDVWPTAIKPVLYDAYFDCLAARLAGKRQRPWSRCAPTEKTGFAAQGLAALEALANFVAGSWTTQAHWPSLAELYGAFPLEAPLSRRHDLDRQFIGVRLALADIAFDHVLLGRALRPDFVISASDVDRAARSSFWLDEVWVPLFVERRFALHSPDAASLVFERAAASLRDRPAESNERADGAVRLALFAADHGLVEPARRGLAHALGCLLGYGWRKDPFASEVLDAIGLMLEAGDQDARQWLLDVAGPIEQILDYTDGKGTRHARSQLHALLLEHLPDRASRCLEALLDAEEWDYAQKLITGVAASALGDSEAGGALLRTFIAPAERRSLVEAAASDRPGRGALLRPLLAHSGVTLAGERARVGSEAKREKGTPLPKDRKRPPDVAKFPPGRLSDFIVVLSRRHLYVSHGKFLTAWIVYWAECGEADAALADLDAQSAAMGFEIYAENIYNEAARIALAVQGRSKAFEWVVRGQVARNGWSSFYTSEKEAVARFDFVATHFRDRWEEFLRRSSKSASAFRREGGELTVGYVRLIAFLLKVGETARAKTCSRAMIDTYLAEVSEQPIVPPGWAR